MRSLPHIHHQVDFDFDFDLFFAYLEFMALHMITFYEPQATQVNEEPPPKSSLELTLMLHLHEEDPELQKV